MALPDAPMEPDAPAVDASLILDAPIDAAPACDVGPPPSDLPSLVGRFVVLDADAGLPIAPLTGGDPTGVWRFDAITLYTAPTSRGMFDEATSTVSGTAWAVVEGDRIRLELSLDLALMGTAAGTVRRRNVTHIRGTYAVTGSTLALTPECIDPTPMGAPVAPQFSTEGETGRLLLTLEGMLGTNQIVLSGARTST